MPPALHLPDWPVLTVGVGLDLAVVATGLSLVVDGLVRATRPALLREEANRHGEHPGRPGGRGGPLLLHPIEPPTGPRDDHGGVPRRSTQ